MPQIYKYEYDGELKDGIYARAVIERDVADVAGITYQAVEDRTIVQFDRELTETEKSTLDDIMATNPTPDSRYEYGALDPGDYIESVMGVRPVRIDYDDERDVATVDFDTTLTDVQKRKLRRALRVLRGRRLRRRI